ncbi:MAG: TolC family protein [Candidatus Rokubacteria bacterium]|nr:TolC family protein [Candidatus Rokubacteria bacterium]
MTRSLCLLIAALLGGLASGAQAETSAQQGNAGRAVQRAADDPVRSYDLSLAVETAIRNHPALGTALARSEASKTGIAVAATKYRPSIVTSVAVNKTLAGNESVVIQNEIVTQALPVDPFYTASVTLVVPIIREGRLTFTSLPSEEVAKAGYESVKYGEQLARAEIRRDVTVAFVTALAAREAVRVNEQTVELNRRLVSDTRVKFEQQLIPQSDVLAAESALAAADAALATARIDLARSQTDFVNALGLDPSERRSLELVDTGDPPPPVPPLEALLRQVMSRHPSALTQEAIVRQAQATLEQLTRERYPTLDFDLTVGSVDDFSPPVDLYSLRALFRLNWKIWDFGNLDLRIKQQTETLRAEKRTADQVKTLVSKEVISAYRNFVATQSGLQAAQKAVASKEELARAAKERFEQDLIPLSALLQSEVDLAVARNTLTQTSYTLRIQYAQLQAALGTE